MNARYMQDIISYHLSHVQADCRQIASPLILGFLMCKMWIKIIPIS